MRHEAAAGAIVTMLRSLQMSGLDQAVTDLIDQGASAYEAAIQILSRLLQAALAALEFRTIAYRMKSAGFLA